MCIFVCVLKRRKWLPATRTVTADKMRFMVAHCSLVPGREQKGESEKTKLSCIGVVGTLDWPLTLQLHSLTNANSPSLTLSRFPSFFSLLFLFAQLFYNMKLNYSSVQIFNVFWLPEHQSNCIWPHRWDGIVGLFTIILSHRTSLNPDLIHS